MSSAREDIRKLIVQLNDRLEDPILPSGNIAASRGGMQERPQEQPLKRNPSTRKKSLVRKLFGAFGGK